MWIDKDGNEAGSSIVLNMAEEGEEPLMMRIFNPTDAQYIAAGFTWKVPEPTPEEIQHRQEFEAACAQFRDVCAQIAQAANLPGFKGGFDDMPRYYATEYYATLPGLQLAAAWDGMDKYCTYCGKKIGLGQPEWWYECWRLTESSQQPTQEA